MTAQKQSGFICKNCKDNQFELIYKNLPDYLYGFEGRFCYAKCKICNLIQIFETPDNLSRYYSSYRLHSQDHRLYHLFRKVFLKHCYYFPKSSGGKILDVGCGNGWYLKEIEQKGWKCYGYEYDKEYAKGLSKKLGLLILCEEDIDKYNSYFDLITLNFSLEHLNEPRAILSKLYLALKQGGEIVISLPNIKSWESKIFKSRWFHLDPPRHITFFTAGLLSKMLEFLGFYDIQIKNLPIPTGFAGSISYVLFTRFVPWVWYLNILPGYFFSRLVRDGNYMVTAVKK